jgi:hypothetical protein
MAEMNRDGLPEKIGGFLGLVIFAVTCALVIYPLLLHIF